MTWRAVHGYAPGTSHLESNTPCQDRCVFESVRSDDGGDVLIGVVSDGAGSARHAEAGAQAVCDELLALVRVDVRASSDLDELSDDRVRSWFLEVREALRTRALAAGDDLRDYAATALLAVASDHQTLCAQIGDGAIVVRPLPGGAFDLAIWPDGGEYVNHTYFITDETAAERVAIRRYDGVADLVALTDGLQRLALSEATRSAFEPFFEPLVRAVRGGVDVQTLRAELVDYLGSNAINARTDDDKAILIGCRMDAA